MQWEKQLLEQIQEMERLIQFLKTPSTLTQLNAIAQALTQRLKQGGKIFTCGNGGSMCDAMHFAEELTGRFREDRLPLAAIAISDPSHLTCVANDYGYDKVFERYIAGVATEKDALIAISTSGNSPNVLNAAQMAKTKNMLVVGLTGKTGGKLAPLCDYAIIVPHHDYADRIQEIHIKCLHLIIYLIERYYEEITG